MNLKDKIRVIPDFPVPGIRFKDITTLLKDGSALGQAIDDMARMLAEVDADVLVGPEARGFLIGAPLAYKLRAGFIPVRKSGKLPADVLSATYELEYGKDKLEIHKDAFAPGTKVLVVDDLLATGGTIWSTVDLVRQLGGEVVAVAFLIELTYLDGREKLAQYPVYSLIKF